MLKKLVLAAMLILGSSPAWSQASFSTKDSTGATISFKSFNCTPICALQVPADTTGAAFGVIGNPFFINFASGATLPPFGATPTVNLGTIGTAATAANQTTGNTSLSSIDGKTPALGQALAASSVPVVMTAAQITTLTPLSTVAVTNAGTFAAQLTGATNNINNIAGTVSLPTGAATSALQGTNTATTAHTCSTGGFSELGCLGQIDDDIKAAIPAGTNTIGGTTPVAAATGGATYLGNIAANNTTAVVVKNSAGTLYSAQLGGIGSAPAYLKLYDATSATCGSGTPVKRLIIPAASTAANGGGSNINFGTAGVAFATGITYCITTGIADNDTTAPAASTFLVNLDWK